MKWYEVQHVLGTQLLPGTSLSFGHRGRRGTPGCPGDSRFSSCRTPQGSRTPRGSRPCPPLPPEAQVPCALGLVRQERLTPHYFPSAPQDLSWDFCAPGSSSTPAAMVGDPQYKPGLPQPLGSPPHSCHILLGAQWLSAP